MLRLFAVSSLLLVVTLSGVPDPDRPSREPPRAPDLAAGLRRTLSSGKDAHRRRAPWIAIHVPKDEVASAFIEPGPFFATFEGLIDLPSRTRFELKAEGRGSVRVLLGGKEVLSADEGDWSQAVSTPERYRRGTTPLRVVYESPAKGDARFRLLWRPEGQPYYEPLPHSILKHESSAEDTDLLADEARTRGREAFLELRCFNCHGDTEAGTDPSLSYSEAEIHGPDLKDVGQRLHGDFLFAWLSDPSAYRPNARMPHLLKHLPAPERDQAAADLTAFLLQLSGAGQEEKLRATKEESALATQGRGLFADLGCIACHALPSRMELPPDDDRVLLRQVPRKFLRGQIAKFLQNPQTHFAATRMPNFGMSVTEAEALEAFLRGQGEPVPYEERKPGDAERGRKLADDLRCFGCHPGLPSSDAPILRISNALAGCLSSEQTGREPRFAFKEHRREDLAAFLADGRKAFTARSVFEEGDRLLRELQCTACHDMESLEDRWTRYESEAARFLEPRTGQLDQSRPSLTYAGDKLHTTWIKPFLESAERERLRPWLRARMPAFGVRAEALALGLAARHGVLPEGPAPLTTTEDMVEHGGVLVGRDGFGCTACHDLLGEPAYAQFEVGAPDFRTSYERLRTDHFHRWMWNPRRIDPASRMPVYVDQEGTTQFDEILDGVGERQFEAIWQYLGDISRRRSSGK